MSKILLGTACVIAGATAQAQCVWTPAVTSAVGEIQSGSMAYDSVAQRLVLVDYTFQSNNNRTWVRSGNAWTLATAAGPTRRAATTVVFDSARNRLVLFGGYSFPTITNLGDTWEWDGANWIAAATTGPSPRRDAQMAYDSARSRVVLFGGNGALVTAETWEWDGVSWSLRSTMSPSPRYWAAMAYDPGVARTFLFGGSTGAGELWEWDGTVWTERSVAGPSARSQCQFVYDPGRARLVLFGGFGGIFAVGETWEFDAAANVWTLRSGGAAPGAATGAFAFDAARGRALLLPSSTSAWEWNGSGTTSSPAVSTHPVGGQFNPGATIVLTVAGVWGPTYQWLKDGVTVMNGGTISGAQTPTLTITPAQIGDTGAYSALLTTSCGSVTSNVANVFVVGGPCYANCDGSTAVPILNVNDFVCFLNKFVVLDPYANCDSSTVAPVFNVMDFICFNNRFASGCP
ncbi:MAG: kelch repeat-containing protein [Phycisphaerales bacterium]